jgi:hypothetical protein
MLRYVSPTPPVADEDDSGFDLAPLRDWASYAIRAIRLHPTAVLVPTVVGLVLGLFVGRSIPNKYYTEARLLSQRPDVSAVLSGPGRSALSDPTAATRAIAEVVQRRDNLLALISQTGLVQQWRSSRSALLRVKDWIVFGGTLSDDELTEVLVGILELDLDAWSKDGTMGIAATWNDPDIAQRLVDASLQNYLETRHVSEMAILGESISLLESRLAEAQQGLDQALVAARGGAPRRRASTASLLPLPQAPDEPSLELSRLRSEIAAKRRAAEDLVVFRDRKIAELQAQLAEQRAVYSESHPVVLNIQRSLEALAADSPQLAALRQELRELETQYVRKGGTPDELDRAAPRRPSSSAPAVIAALEGPTRDPGEEYARSRLAAAIARYYSIVDRLEAVRLERDAARVSIKYRFLVVRPPLRPRDPINGRFKAVVPVAGAFAGLAFGALLAVGLELRRGRVVQAWQVERGLGLPILAELPPTSSLREGRPA